MAHRWELLFPWIAWLVCSLFLLFQFLLQFSISVMVPDLMQAFHISPVALGFLSSAYFYTYLLLQIPAGILVDRFGPRRVLTYALIVFAISCVLFGLAQDLRMAKLARLLMGLAAAPAFPATLYAVGYWFSPQRFAFMFGITETFGMIGSALGQWLLVSSVRNLGWRASSMLCGLCAFFLLIAVRFGLDTNTSKYRVTGKQPEVLNFRESMCALKKVLTNRRLWTNSLFFGCTFALVNAFASLWGVPYVQELYGVSREVSAFANSFVFLGVALGTPLLGWLHNRVNHCLLIYTDLAISFVILLLVLYVPIPLWIIFPAFFCLGMSTGLYVLPFALVNEIAPKGAKATVIACVNAIGVGVSAILLHPLIGYLLAWHSHGIWVDGVLHFSLHDYHVALMTLPMCILVALLLVPWL